MKDEELKESKLLLEVEIKNLQKFVDPAKKIVEELELKEELSEEEKKKLEDSKSEVLLLEKEIKEREDKIKDIDEEVKHREEVRLQIDNALKDLDFEEEEVLKKWDREKEEEVEYKEPLIKKFLHDFDFCDHIEIKEEDEEGVEFVKEVKHFPWDKESVLKDLKLKLDLDKANDLVRRVKDYKHNKKKSELEKRLKPMMENRHYFEEVWGVQYSGFHEINGEKIPIIKHEQDHVAEWDKDDLEFFEDQVLKLELAKKHLDNQKKKEKPIKDRQVEYSKIDGLLLEALVEKLEEGRPEKMDKYLELRKDIKHRHPIEED